MEANDASLGAGDVTSRAQQLRANLGARHDAEGLLAEASRIRQDAASAADAMVAEAQQLSEQLVAESRLAAEQLTTEARERAEGVLARARTEAEEAAAHARASAEALRAAAEADIEEHRRRVRVEVTAQVTAQVTRDLIEEHRLAETTAREESEALISDLEASVRILGVSLESALANVSELLGSLEALRPTADPATVVVDAPDERAPSAPRAGGAHLVDTHFGLQPASALSVPSASSPFGTEGDDEPTADPHRPLTATEAFLSSSNMEIEQSSQELRDLQHPEEARRRRSEESRRTAQARELEALESDVPADETDREVDGDAAEAARPLGWLFRTAQ